MNLNRKGDGIIRRQVVDGIEYKRCSNCFEFKPTSDFYLSRTKGPGKTQSHCKKCHPEIAQGVRKRRNQKQLQKWVRGEES